jgi:hypothetical protein
MDEATARGLRMKSEAERAYLLRMIKRETELALSRLGRDGLEAAIDGFQLDRRSYAEKHPGGAFVLEWVLPLLILGAFLGNMIYWNWIA